jgi:hypothetical protein
MDVSGIKKSLPPSWNRTTILFYPTGSLVVVPVPVGSTFIISPGFTHGGARDFLFYKTFEQTASWAHQTSYLVYVNVLLPEVKGPGVETNHLYLQSAQVKTHTHTHTHTYIYIYI